MTKRKTRALAHSLDADWPPRQQMTLTELIAEARAVDWPSSIFTIFGRTVGRLIAVKRTPAAGREGAAAESVTGTES